ncbi:MAG: Serine/threonine-protein phosphatase 2A activator 1 [Pleopsidium flavum]|nr:MAG: Serine/threonine-protein phosphatase 2A activator 1 [Pleopsidium flavum]
MATTVSSLEVLDPSQAHIFVKPTKKIHEGQDVPPFLMSRAYRDVTTFIMQLNGSMFPRLVQPDGSIQRKTQVWELGSTDISYSDTVGNLRELLGILEAIIDEAPPDTGPRRFGNVSFRKWYSIVELRTPELLKAYLPAKVLAFGGQPSGGGKASDELEAYLLGSFGSPQRLDYGTGHELSFVAFLACVWKLGGFGHENDGVEERGIVLGLIEPYLIRRLVMTYNLEPAGSHGVWGLDDHFFIPYIFGSAQLAPPISESDQIPAEGSLADAPDPADVAKSNVVQRERGRNMYFSAVGFIYDVKRGPFWEHSPILFDISGIRAGWAKINKVLKLRLRGSGYMLTIWAVQQGMIKMYNAEVLSKFPVVQHFPFGSLLTWEQDPNAVFPPNTVHTSNHPSRATLGVDRSATTSSRAPYKEATTAPWAGDSRSSLAGSMGTTAPWPTPSSTSMAPPVINAVVSGPIASRSSEAPLPPLARGMPATQAPWASGAVGDRKKANLPTRAPWARPEGGGTAPKQI